MIHVTIIPVLQDNYAYLIETPDNGPVAVLDPGEAAPVIRVLEEKNLSPAYILNTHHHGDHIAGNRTLKEKYGAKIIGPDSERARIPDMDTGLREGDIFILGEEKIEILETPGHTRGGICYHLPQSRTLFTGDTLFSLGCGRLFEGTPEQMYASLGKIAALPDDTQIYCGHEYTQENAAFCQSIEPDSAALKTRVKEIETLRSKHRPTLPVSLKTEKETNVFLRAGTAEEFAIRRSLKDRF